MIHDSPELTTEDSFFQDFLENSQTIASEFS